MKIFGKLNLYLLLLKRFWRSYTPVGRPHYFSKNAWSYRVKGQITPAMALLLRLGA